MAGNRVKSPSNRGKKPESWNDVQRRVKATGGSVADASAEWVKVKAAGRALIKRRKPRPIPEGADRKLYDKNGRLIPKQLKDHYFKKGNRCSVGHGRPKSSLSMTTKLREAILSADEDMLRLVVDSIYTKAINGDMVAAKMIWERLDGKVPDQIIADVLNRGPLADVPREELRRVVDARRNGNGRKV